jgi:dTDP-4-amino-4,6-dideoxygalactose transaminase
MTDSIPLVDIAAQQREVASTVQGAVAHILETGAFIGGPAVATFEEAYADYLGVDHCIGVGNGTDALELALRVAGVGPGDEVILPANTFIATAEAVVRAGAVPVLVDVDEEYLLIDPEAIAGALTPHTRAVLPVHLFGQAAPMEHVHKAVEGTGVLVLEDAAQSQGARRNGVAAGALSLAAATSFYPGKNLGAAGDAGAIVSDDADLARRARLLSCHGSERKYVHEVVGFNSRLDAIQAVVLSAKLGRLDAWNDARRAAAARYDELLADLPQVRTPATLPGNDHVWHLYVIRLDSRDKVLAGLLDRGIGAGIHYPTPVHRTAAFAGVAGSNLSVSERAAGEILSLPLFPHITEEQQVRVVDALGEVLRTS